MNNGCKCVNSMFRHNKTMLRDCTFLTATYMTTSRMIILDDQARQQITLHFQLSLQCNVLPITGFIRHTA